MRQKNTVPEKPPYSSHSDQLESIPPHESRRDELAQALKAAFSPHIETRQTVVILFDEVSATELANAFVNYPVIVKSVLASVNVAARAVARDLGITLDTYKGTIDDGTAAALAGYLKPMLPKELPIPALVELDRYFWTDKSLRAQKGNFEKRIVAYLELNSGHTFRKRQFESDARRYELDAAYPPSGDGPIEVGVDIKRVESPRDVHKRADEIINKATEFKRAYPDGKFFAVVYYPHPAQHQNMSTRLRSQFLDGEFFVNETNSSIDQATQMLLGKAGYLLADSEDETGDL